MPVTAKFSRDFYDRFGHEAVDELVDFLNRIDAGYRAELQELNDRNFGRFDDRLERRLAELQARLDTRIDRVAAAFDAKIDHVATALDAKIDHVATALDAKIDYVATELDAKIERRATEIRADLKAGLAAMESRLVRWMFLFVATAVLTILGLG